MTNTKTIYISGGVSGVKDYLNHFNEAELLLTNAGFRAINPARVLIGASKTLTRDQLVELCGALLSQCGAIYLLKGWNYSTGSRQELKLAESMDIKVIYESTYELDDEVIAMLKNTYSKGTRIKLIQMANDPCPTKPGTLGTVNHVDDAGVIHMFWDTGSTLGLVPSCDVFEVVREDS